MCGGGVDEWVGRASVCVVVYPRLTHPPLSQPRPFPFIYQRQDFNLVDSLAHFDRERIPERVVHAKGAGAMGYFEVSEEVEQERGGRRVGFGGVCVCGLVGFVAGGAPGCRLSVRKATFLLPSPSPSPPPSPSPSHQKPPTPPKKSQTR